MKEDAFAPTQYQWNDADWRAHPWHEVVAFELALTGATHALAARHLPVLTQAGIGAIVLSSVATVSSLVLSEFVDRAHAAGLMVLQRAGAVTARAADFHLDGLVDADDLPPGVFGDDDVALRRLVAAWTHSGAQPLVWDLPSGADAVANASDQSQLTGAGRTRGALRWPMSSADPPWREAWDICALLSPPVPLLVADADAGGVDPARWRSLISLRRRELVPRLAQGHGQGAYRVDGGLVRIEWPLGDASSWHLVANMSASAVTTGAMSSSWTVHASRTRPALPGEIEIDPGGVLVAVTESGG